MTRSASEIEVAVISLYEARLAAKEARANHRRKAAQVGQCDGKGEDSGMCYNDPALNLDEWCDACKAKQPLWEDYHRKVSAKAAALRRVVAMGKSLSKKVPVINPDYERIKSGGAQ